MRKQTTTHAPRGVRGFAFLAVFALLGALALLGQQHTSQAAANFPCEASPWQVLFRFPETDEQVTNGELWRVDFQELAQTGRLSPDFAGLLTASNPTAAKAQGKEVEYFVISIDQKTTLPRVCMDYLEAHREHLVSMPNPDQVDPNNVVKLATALVGTSQPQPQTTPVVVQQPAPKKPGFMSSMLRYTALPLGFAFKSTPMGLAASSGAALISELVDRGKNVENDLASGQEVKPRGKGNGNGLKLGFGDSFAAAYDAR